MYSPGQSMRLMNANMKLDLPVLQSCSLGVQPRMNAVTCRVQRAIYFTQSHDDALRAHPQEISIYPTCGKCLLTG
jgi:hypothetical protein